MSDYDEHHSYDDDSYVPPKAQERKGAAYTIKSRRSHDYSGQEQVPHRPRPVRGQARGGY